MQHWFSLSKRAHGQMQEVVCDGKDERGLCIYFLPWGLVCMPRCMCRGIEAVLMAVLEAVLEAGSPPTV